MTRKIAIAWAVACTLTVAKAQQFTISGHLDGQENEQIIVKGPNGDVSVQAINGSFTLSGPASEEPFVTTLTTSVDRNLYLGGGKTGMYMPAQPLEIVLTPNASLTIKGSTRNLHLASVTGDELNESFTAFRKAEEKDVLEMDQLRQRMVELRIMGLKEEQEATMKRMVELHQAISASRKRYINENPGAFASVYYLSRNAREYQPEELEAAYNKLADTYKNTRYGRGLVQRIAAAKSLHVGGVSPDFTKPDVNGKLVSLSQFRGKYVLLDFWGSWCGPCRAANPHLKSLYEKYQADGLEILGVASEKVNSQEQAEKVWKAAIEADGLTWTNVLNNEVDMKQDVTQLYQIEGYPTQILLDREGKIIARWLGSGAQQLDDQLKDIFNH
ncbi:redoxin domain-containing protein [Parapedobacter deserti]|uniref:Redoxin domain-containing protein n=1 Tax=Parapedobacter deserti TaxID=1912957 RepID=A0ABV7JIL6_9SPHI